MKGGYTAVPHSPHAEHEFLMEEPADPVIKPNSKCSPEKRISEYLNTSRGVCGGKLLSLYYMFTLVVTVCVTLGVVLSYSRVRSLNVIKPLLDKKQYRALELENGLHVLLIEDPNSIMSGAGLDVKVGSMSDLEAGHEYNGLAHYTEHAMYMGSKDFPTFNELANYLQRHGGNDNAFTTQTHTNYYFYVNSPYFAHGLEIFSSCFKSPLFDKAVLEGEKQAIQNELEKDIPQPTWKKFSLLKVIVDPAHPFQRFNVGSKEIFDSADFHSKIKWFYNKYYSSNLMNLVILSSQVLDAQEDMVRKYFGTIQNRNVTTPTYYGNPYPSGTQYINQYVVYDNGGGSNELHLVFPIAWTEEDMKKDHKVIVTLLGDEGAGTITTKLRDLGLIMRLTVSTLQFSRSFTCITMQIDTTPEGFCNVKKILKVVFDYIKVMREGVDKEIWQDDYEKRRIRFNYHDETSLKTILKTIPGWMADSDPENYLALAVLNKKFNKKDIFSILDRLVPENLNILQGGTNFDTMRCDFTEFDKFDDRFKTAYHAGRIPQDWIDNWSSDKEATADLALPLKNNFLPQDFTILPAPSTELPVITIDSEGFKAYWRKDSSLPKSYVNCKFYVPQVSATAKDSAWLRLYLGIVSESLDTIAYPASSVEFRYAMIPLTGSFKMKIEGFSDQEKFYMFLKMVVDALKNPQEITKLRYKYQVEEMEIDNLNKIYTDQPFRQAFYLSRLFYQLQSHDNGELMQNLRNTNQKEVLEWGRQNLQDMAIKCLTSGNHEVEQSLQYSSYIEQQFNQYNLKSYYAESQPVISLPPGRWLWPRRNLNPAEPNNCVFMMNEISENTVGADDLRRRVLLTILGTIMKDPAYATLRTKQQLGYTVFVGTLKMYDVNFFYLLLQGSHYAPGLMTEKVIDFLADFRIHLETLVINGTAEYNTGQRWFSSATFEAINMILALPVSQSGLADHYSDISQSPWPYYNSGRYLIAAVKSLVKDDLLVFYDRYIIGNSRQLIIQLHGSAYPIQNTTTTPHAGIIKDVKSFRRKLTDIAVDFIW